MNTIQSIQIFVAINLFTIGLSHLLQPKIWVDFFKFLHSKGNVGNIFNALLALGMGSIIISFHFIWTWPMILVTLYGLSQLIKGIIYLTFPSIGLNSIGKVQDKFIKFKWAGLIMCLSSILIIVYLINNTTNIF
ncbi:hypothetical protein [Aquimarina sp. 2201CG14-23]|uniref:hypothetical protein n=1 Tax=Aquimarina mycalae TaxID=3040073 RepID=UPI0024782D24|nr:hypothetical protein [Aquimarina sp. 2201CG14-23]MDH7446528.1 hypothetical protein [Aquimarina sp. 2201CG14-23]